MFHRFFLNVFDFYVVTSEPSLSFGSRRTVFLFGKAETAVKTRQVFATRPENTRIARDEFSELNERCKSALLRSLLAYKL